MSMVEVLCLLERYQLSTAGEERGCIFHSSVCYFSTGMWLLLFFSRVIWFGM